MNDRLEIGERIEAAVTLPGRAYADEELFELQKERIFARAWHFIGHEDQFKTPGRAVPFTLLEGCLDEPLLLTRDDDGALRCLSNVCTHRGNILVEGECQLKTIRCRYHGKRFALDGRFLNMPGFEGAEGFPSPADDLPRLPVRQFGPFLFTALDPSVGFEGWLDPLPEFVGWMPLQDFLLDPSDSQDYLVKANWALYCDNYLEGFHIPFVHQRTLSGALDFDQYEYRLFSHGSLQIGVAGRGEECFFLPDGHPLAGRRIAAMYFWLFPNLMLNFYPWGLSVNIVQPLSVDRMRVSFRSFVWDASKRKEGAGAQLHRVEMEDEEIVEMVQRGVRSRLYRRGRYSPKHEGAVHHFHRLLAAALE